MPGPTGRISVSQQAARCAVFRSWEVTDTRRAAGARSLATCPSLQCSIYLCLPTRSPTTSPGSLCCLRPQPPVGSVARSVTAPTPTTVPTPKETATVVPNHPAATTTFRRDTTSAPRRTVVAKRTARAPRPRGCPVVEAVRESRGRLIGDGRPCSTQWAGSVTSPGPERGPQRCADGIARSGMRVGTPGM